MMMMMFSLMTIDWARADPERKKGKKANSSNKTELELKQKLSMNVIII